MIVTKNKEGNFIEKNIQKNNETKNKAIVPILTIKFSIILFEAKLKLPNTSISFLFNLLMVYDTIGTLDNEVKKNIDVI